MVAAHRSVLLVALESGHLARLTRPVHRYLIENGALRADVRPQYARDMQERWMLNADPHRRNRASSSFAGLIAELHLAECIETTRESRIVGLEALREGPDVEAQDGAGVTTAFEVKTLGIERNDFEMVLQSLANGPSGRAVSPRAAINYMLFRVYEAAKQLERFGGRRIAVAVFDLSTGQKMMLNCVYS